MKNKKKIKISIVVLNFNGKKVTEECLKSVEKQTYKNYEVILIDNDSSDGSYEYFKKKFQKYNLFRTKANLGYAGGNNFGFKKAKGEYILILNNDVVLEKDFLKALIDNKEKGDILGVKNYYYDIKNVLWAVGSKVNVWTSRASLIGNKEEDKGQYDKIKIPQAVGSAMFIKKKVFDKIGYFDEGFFCYFEETDWQTRALNEGFKIGFVPEAKLWHRVGYSSGGGRTSFSSYYLVRNRAYYISRWSKYKVISYIIWLLEVAARIFRGLIKRDLPYSKASFKGFIDFLKRKKGATFKI